MEKIIIIIYLMLNSLFVAAQDKNTNLLSAKFTNNEIELLLNEIEKTDH